MDVGFCVCAFSSFATLENSGLLFYNGRFNEKHDFIALEIQEGQVVLKYSTGTFYIVPVFFCILELSVICMQTVFTRRKSYVVLFGAYWGIYLGVGSESRWNEDNKTLELNVFK